MQVFKGIECIKIATYQDRPVKLFLSLGVISLKTKLTLGTGSLVSLGWKEGKRAEIEKV